MFRLANYILLLSVSALLSGGAKKGHSQAENIAIVNIVLFAEPYKPPVENATILISEGKFREAGPAESIRIPEGYQVINGTGRYAIAGYWNSHVHFMEPKWNDAHQLSKDSLEHHLRQMFTSRGFVYVFDLAQIDFQNIQSIRNRVQWENLKSPTILAVGVPFTSKSPFYISPLKLPELKSTEEVDTHIANQVSAGAEGIKIWTASPTGTRIDYLSPQLIREAATAAAKYRIPLFAHPSNLKGVELAVDNGVSVLAHVAADDRLNWDSGLLQKMIRNEVALIPTLKLHFWDQRMAGISTENNMLIKTAIRQLSDFNKSGGLVLFGTDVGYMSDYDIEEELVQMENAGMSFDQILASLTSNPAKKFNRAGETGTVERGKNADLVILNGNPASDIRNFTKVVMTIHNGKVVFEKH
jgi:imidazolonepropionase-like amidohydrolase